jgi:hypothetical protein
MPTPLGPRFASAALNCWAITSKASSHDTWVNSPFLWYLPSFLRRSGCVRRSWPYIIFERKYPLTQLSPRLTSALVSPWVATTRPSLVATITPHPVPQNRQGPFVPPQFGERSIGDRILRRQRRWHSARRCRHCSSFQFQEFTAVQSVFFPRRSPFAVFTRRPCRETPVLPSARGARLRLY